MIARRALGYVLVVAGVALALASLVVDAQGARTLDGWATQVGTDPDLFAWLAGAVGIVSIGVGASLAGASRHRPASP